MHSSSNIQPVRLNQLMSYNRYHSGKPNRNSAIDIAYYNTSGIPGAHVNREGDHVSTALNFSLLYSLQAFGLGSENAFTSIDAQGSRAFLDGTTANPGHHTHMHLQGFNRDVYPILQIIDNKVK